MLYRDVGSISNFRSKTLQGHFVLLLKIKRELPCLLQNLGGEGVPPVLPGSYVYDAVHHLLVEALRKFAKVMIHRKEVLMTGIKTATTRAQIFAPPS